MNPISHRLAALGLGLLLASTAIAGPPDFPAALDQWIAVEPPRYGSDEWAAASNDIEHEWLVTLRDGRPRAELRD